MLAFAITALVVLVAAAIALAWAWYVKAPVRMAFIRTGVGGRKVMIDRGTIVIPGLHEIQWISLETFKLEVFKANRRGLRGRGGDGDEGPVGRVISSFLNAGAALPLLKELLDFAKADPQAMLKKVAEHVPALREAMGPKG